MKKILRMKKVCLVFNDALRYREDIILYPKNDIELLLAINKNYEEVVCC